MKKVNMSSKPVENRSRHFWPAVDAFLRLGLLGHLGIGFGLAIVVSMAAAQEDTKIIAPKATNPSAISHFVEPGDTLWMISQRYYGQALKWPEIRFDNRIAEPRHLQPGTTLLLRSAGPGNAASVVAVTGDVRIMTPIIKVANTTTVTNVAGAARAVVAFANKLFSKSLPDISQGTMNAGALIEKGDILPVGTTLKTGPDSFITLLMPNGSRATLPSNSQIKLVSFKDAKGQASVLLDLSMGQVDARVQHSDEPSIKSSYRVRTRLATIGARGTYFRVALPDSQRTLATVLEGTVAVNWGQENILNHTSELAKPTAALLSEGQGSEFFLGAVRKPATVQSLLPAPVLQDASAPQNQSDVLIRWLPVQGAAAYRAQVAKDAEFNDLLAQQDIAAQEDIQNALPASNEHEAYKTWFTKLGKGSYFARVSAVAADGLEGFFSLAGFSRTSYEISGDVALTADNEKLEFSWTSLPGSNYSLELAEDAEFTKVVLIAPDLLSNRVQIKALAPAQYFWRVTASIQEHGQTTTVVSKINSLLVGGSR